MNPRSARKRRRDDEAIAARAVFDTHKSGCAKCDDRNLCINGKRLWHKTITSPGLKGGKR